MISAVCHPPINSSSVYLTALTMSPAGCGLISCNWTLKEQTLWGAPQNDAINYFLQIWYALAPTPSHHRIQFMILVFICIQTSACGSMSSGPCPNALACSVNCEQSDDRCQPTLSKDSWCSLVLSRLDYRNATLAGLPAYLFNQLHAVINAGARLILKVDRREHITPLLRQLHWPRDTDRITFKLATLMFHTSASMGLLPVTCHRTCDA